MVRVKMRVTPSLSWLADAKSAGWLNLEKEIPDGTTLSDFLTELTANNTGFRKMLIDTETGKVSEQVEVILNQNLVQFPYETEIKLKNGDLVTFLPVYAGG